MEKRDGGRFGWADRGGCLYIPRVDEATTSSNWKAFLQRWAVNTLAVLVAANVVRGISYDSVGSLLVASLLLGVLNSFLRPIMLLLSLPLLIVTLGLFTFVINALLLYFVGWVVEPFHVASFGAAFWGGLVISLVSLVVNFFLGSRTFTVRTVRRGPPKAGPGDGGGPIIDV